jgi:imidazole glycerol-phosphate synthase subunit HisH
LRGVKVPHMGWNTVEATAEHAAGPLAGLPSHPYAYFVHSYYVELERGEEDAAAATTEYGGRFVSALARANVWGTQFHPEKSSGVGAQVLRNFVVRCGEVAAT